MTRARLSSAAIELMRLFPPVLALVFFAVAPLVGVCGCATSNATEEDLGSPIIDSSSPPKDSSLRDNATFDMDSASNDSSISDGDITDTSDSSIDDSGVDAGCLGGGLCFAGFLCCNKVSSVNYGKCESIACAGCCK